MNLETLPEIQAQTRKWLTPEEILDALHQTILPVIPPQLSN